MRHIKKLAIRTGNKGTQITTTDVTKRETPKITIQKNVIMTDIIESSNPVINILTRTSNRPNGFKRCRESIENQTYKNIRHLVSIDNMNDEEYVKGYNVEYFFMDKEAISKEPDIADPQTGNRFIYNLYLNHLINEVKEGWVFILDDDDYFADQNCVQKMVNAVKNGTDLILWQMKYPNGHVLPSLQELGKPPRLARISSQCFMLHSAIAKKIRWDGWKCGDFRFVQKAYAKTGEKRVIREVLVNLGGAGLGMKRDINETAPNFVMNNINKGSGEINPNAALAGFRNKHAKNIEVIEKKKYIDLKEYKFIIGISSYSRAESLDYLLNQIHSFTNNNLFKVIVLDDFSPEKEKYSNIISKYENIIYIRNEKNYGKKLYWKSINKILENVKKHKFEWFIQLDDDFELIDNFFEVLEKMINNFKNDIIKLHLDSTSNGIRWGLTKWVDGGTVYPKLFIEKINYSINEISLKRWERNAYLSSGVWEQVSKQINKYNYNVITPNFSFTYHTGYKDSVMNTELRKKQNLKTINFKR